MMREKYESLPLATLKELAKARGIKGLAGMKKEDVVEKQESKHVDPLLDLDRESVNIPSFLRSRR